MIDPPKTSREEDYRDYEERDLRDGWPYADTDGLRTPQRNPPYGAPKANFDEQKDSGVEVSDGTIAEDIHGKPQPFADTTGEIIEDDALEERITGRLEDDGRIDPTALEITVRDGVVKIEGGVDSEADRAHLIGLVLAVPGVRDVHARDLIARGVDSHIPPDSDE